MTDLTQDAPGSQAPMTAVEFCQIVANVFRDEPDDYPLSLGHWAVTEPDTKNVWDYTPFRFYADVAITVGELRRMSKL